MASRRPGIAPADSRRRRPSTARFRALLREASQDPLAAAELTAAYATLPPLERRALRRAVQEDAASIGLDVERMLACWSALDPDRWVSARPWRAWADDEGVVFAAPGRGAVEAQEAEIRLHDDGWAPSPSHRAVDVEEAVDRLAAALWAARRAGRPWPRKLGAFADLFDR